MSIRIKTSFTSLQRPIMFSALTMLSFVGYVFLEARYFLEKWIPGDGALMVETIIVLLIVGGWQRALFAAADGSRGGLTALLALSTLATLIALYDLQFVFNTPMPWPQQFMNIVMLVLCVLATAVLALRMQQPKRIS